VFIFDAIRESRIFAGFAVFFLEQRKSPKFWPFRCFKEEIGRQLGKLGQFGVLNKL